MPSNKIYKETCITISTDVLPVVHDNMLQLQSALPHCCCPLAGFGITLCLITGWGGDLVSVFVKQIQIQLRVHISHMAVSLVNKYRYTGGGFIAAVLPRKVERK